MGFKQAIEFAKKLQTTFTTSIPDGNGDYFEATFRLLTGEESVWALRIDPSRETETSFSFQQDLRTAVSSLVKFKDQNEILYPAQIIEVLFSKEELEDPASLLSFNVESNTRLLYSGFWLQLKSCTNEEDYTKLNYLIKEMMWDLLYKGFRLSFDSEYLTMFINHYTTAYRTVRPTLETEQLKRSLQEMLKKLETQNESKS